MISGKLLENLVALDPVQVETVNKNINKLANPSPLPTGTGQGTVFSADGTYLAVGHGGSPHITIYKRSGDTFTKFTNPATLPASVGRGAAFSTDDTYLAVAHSTTPFITIYKQDPLEDLAEEKLVATPTQDVFVNYGLVANVNVTDLGYSLETKDTNEEVEVVSVWRRPS